MINGNKKYADLLKVYSCDENWGKVSFSLVDDPKVATGWIGLDEGSVISILDNGMLSVVRGGDHMVWSSDLLGHKFFRREDEIRVIHGLLVVNEVLRIGTALYGASLRGDPVCFQSGEIFDVKGGALIIHGSGDHDRQCKFYSLEPYLDLILDWKTLECEPELIDGDLVHIVLPDKLHGFIGSGTGRVDWLSYC